MFSGFKLIVFINRILYFSQIQAKFANKLFLVLKLKQELGTDSDVLVLRLSAIN